MSASGPKQGRKQGPHWAAINEVGFIAGMRLMFWIFRIFGRWPFRLVLYPVLLWYVATKPVARHASRDYLQRVAGFSKITTGTRGVFLHFASFAETILDKMLLWGGLFKTDNVHFYGFEQLSECLVKKQGALLICSHLGNLELCRVLSLQREAVRMTVLVHTRHAQAFNQMLAALSPESTLNLLQVTEMTPATAVLLTEKIAQGEFVVIAGDRVPVSPNPRVTSVPFLGAPAAFPVGPYVLASIFQCPVFMLFSMTGKGRPELHLELLRQSIRLPRKGREEVLSDLASEYAARLQFHCLRAPLEWFNFYDFWQAPQAVPLPETPDAPRNL